MKNSIRTADPRAFLPKGKTCSDCAHHDKCKALIGIDGDENACDWVPSRFTQKVTAGPNPDFYTHLNEDHLTDLICRHCQFVQPEDRRLHRHAQYCRLFVSKETIVA